MAPTEDRVARHERQWGCWRGTPTPVQEAEQQVTASGGPSSSSAT